MNGFITFLNFIIDYWMLIVSAIIVIAAGIIKLKDFFSKSKEQKLEIAKKQIRECVLRLVTEAEIDFDDFIKAGQIKRSQVIAQIYAEYEILSTIADQEAVIEFIDEAIDDALDILRDIIKENENSFVINTEEVE